MEDLTTKKCVACEGGTPPLSLEQVEEYKAQLKTDWIAEGNKKIEKKFTFQDFKEAMAFVNNIADLAEEEGHHPEIEIHYNKVEIELSTHAIGGLSENDFILAAKIEQLLS